MDDGEGNTGPRPVELIAAGQAGCTAMDVISILQKKRQKVSGYEVSVTAEEHDGNPSYFTRVDVVHIVEGAEVDEAAVRRAIELSATRYCSVAAMLSAGTVEVHHRYRLVRPGRGEPIEGEVVVIGPHAVPGTVGAARPVATP
jgi:putative redox protein